MVAPTSMLLARGLIRECPIRGRGVWVRSWLARSVEVLAGEGWFAQERVVWWVAL